MLEVTADDKMLKGLSALSNSQEWDYLIAYVSQIRESEIVKLTKKGMSHDESNFVRGMLKRLDKFVQLRNDIASEMAGRSQR